MPKNIFKKLTRSKSNKSSPEHQLPSQESSTSCTSSSLISSNSLSDVGNDSSFTSCVSSVLSTVSTSRTFGEPEMTDEEIEKQGGTVSALTQSATDLYVLDEVNNEDYGTEPRSIIFSMIKSIRKGMDLHTIPFPCFVLEPRSMLERLTDFMNHPQLLIHSSIKDDPIHRFMDVVRYFLSCWHVRPKGVKKPFNPVLGEFFRCKWKCPDNSESFYIGEQVSHHPPVSAYFYSNPDNNVIVTGSFKPNSNFLGNTIVSWMRGSSSVFFTNRPGEEYTMSYPNYYSRGILVGTLLMEIGDTATIRCEKNDLECCIEFVTKGFFTGSYNNIQGKVKKISTGEVLYNLKGKWTDSMFIQKVTPNNMGKSSSEETMSKELFVNVKKLAVIGKLVNPLENQDRQESRKLWNSLAKCIKEKDFSQAQIEKSKVEGEQRHLDKLRAEEGVEWRAKFFYRCDIDNDWHFVDRKVLRESPHELFNHINDFMRKQYQIEDKIQHKDEFHNATSHFGSKTTSPKVVNDDSDEYEDVIDVCETVRIKEIGV